MGILRTAFFLVGTTIGAGFLTGAELVRFFGGGGGMAYLVSCAAWCAQTAFFLYLGKKYGGFAGAMRALFGRAADVLSCALLAALFVPCAGMLAGLDALFPALSPAASVGGLLLVLLVTRGGMKRMSLFNAILVPLLLGYVVCTGGGGEFALHAAGTGKGLLYACMNVAFSAPAVMEAGRNARAPVRAALLAAGCIFVCGIFILGAVSAAGTSASPMPYLAAVGAHPLFFVALACAVLTSLASSLLPLLSACERYAGGQKNAAKALVALAAFLLSRLGLSGVVGALYPVAGVFGALFSAVCVFDEYLFKKHDERVHSRRQQT